MSTASLAVPPESLRTRLMRHGFNFFPALRRTGGRVVHISRDMKHVRVRVPLNWGTRNYVGTIFGGSMYGAVDPIYMVMLIKLLGPGYVVWDRRAMIEYRRPGRSTLTAAFDIDDAELEAIRREVAHRGKAERTYRVELVDAAGKICAVVEKTLHIRSAERA